MSEIAMRVENLSKRYRIGVQDRRSDTMVGAAVNSLMRPIRNLRRLTQLASFDDDNGTERDDIIWALRGVTFDVTPGEVIGVIGRNGAGKSTLLKILTRITKPSLGSVSIHGSVSSLLEVGTGFHPELTGRENVYLNGAVLGMTRREIVRKFDEIVDFSGVEKFIDTPVKRYSTGMKVRLAFSVAAHLEPEILLVDEVLSVGDAAFQKRCLGKMDDVARRGRTVLFVSHNLAAVTRLCGRILLMEKGRLVLDGPSHEVASAYLTSGQGSMAVREWPDLATAPGGEIARLRAVRILDEEGDLTDSIDIRRDFHVEMTFDVLVSGHTLLPHFLLWQSEEGVTAFTAFDLDPEWHGKRRPAGRYTARAVIPGNLLAEGLYTVDARMTTQNPSVIQYGEDAAAAFHVVDSLDGTAARGQYAGRVPGVVRPKFRWTTEYHAPAREQEMVAAPAHL